MRYYLQVLGLASGEISPSFMLFFDNQSYLFNVGEGIQRLCIEHKLRLTKVKDVFITGMNADSLAGLPGLMLTMMETAGTEQRVIHGPPGIASFIQGACTFMWRSYFNVIEYSDHDLFSNQYTFTTDHRFKDLNLEAIIHTLTHQSTNQDNGTCYIIKGQRPPGKFRLEKAIELGVPRGKMFGQLSKGKSIEVNGRVIRPEEVIDASPPAPVLLVLHLPNVDLVPQLTNRWIESLMKPELRFTAAIHLSEDDVLIHQEYQHFVRNLPEMDHIIINTTTSQKSLKDYNVPIARGAAELQIILNRIHSDIFPLNKSLFDRLSDIKLSVLDSSWSGRYIIPKYFSKYILSPLKDTGYLEDALLPLLNPTEILGSLEISDSIEGYEIEGPDYAEIVNTSKEHSDPCVVLLGTGSMLPSKYRNVSGIYVGEWGGGALLDCAENSYGQLLLHYGKEGIEEILQNLKLVTITHIHADHHLGVFKILYERAKYTDEPAIVVGPPIYSIYLNTCQTLMGNLKYIFLNPTDIITVSGLKNVEFVPVDHSVKAYGIVLEHESGWKIVYSGDTRPSQNLVDAGHAATLLIHEATFEDNMQPEAVMRKHSSFGEALEVGRAMGAWRVLLTHFSQRYAIMPDQIPKDALLGFDHMRLKLSWCYDTYNLNQKLCSLCSYTQDESENNSSNV